MENYNPKIVEAIKQHLEEEDIKRVSFDESSGTFSFIINIKGPISICQFLIKVREEDFSVFAFSPLRPTPDKPDTMIKMAEFITRANYGMKSGCFDLDLRDGELRFRCYVNCEENQIPNQSVIRASIGVPAAMLRLYAPGIIAVIFNGMDPESAVEMCEERRDIRRRHVPVDCIPSFEEFDEEESEEEDE